MSSSGVSKRNEHVENSLVLEVDALKVSNLAYLMVDVRHTNTRNSVSIWLTSMPDRLFQQARTFLRLRRGAQSVAFQKTH